MDDMRAPVCIDLLRQHDVGRVCVLCDRTPIALPTSYRLVSDAGAVSIVMRTRPDGVVSRSLGPATFEVDEIDVMHGLAWSVLAQGELRLLPEAPGDPGLQPWVSGRSIWVALVVHAVTGPRITRTAGHLDRGQTSRSVRTEVRTSRVLAGRLDPA